MRTQNLPFAPIRPGMYTADELLQGYDGTPASFKRAVDFNIYRFFVRTGGSDAKDSLTSMMEALHDNTITQSMSSMLAKHRKVVAIMGGHSLSRNDSTYKAAALIARKLSKAKALVVSGGGPGAMEAIHLGAALAGEQESALDAAIETLSQKDVAKFPDGMDKIVSDKGVVNDDLVNAINKWFLPAWKLASGIKNKSVSLGIPTWQYGHEPFTPFASHIAKYFQNSIREDGMLTIARQGIIYVKGSAGTLQEVFQDAAQNYYAQPTASIKYFSPMVFFGVKEWTQDSPADPATGKPKYFPVVPVLKRLFNSKDFDERVLVTDSVDDAVKFVSSFDPKKKPTGN